MGIQMKSGNQRTSKFLWGREGGGNPQHYKKQLLKLPFRWELLIKQAFKAALIFSLLDQHLPVDLLEALATN